MVDILFPKGFGCSVVSLARVVAFGFDFERGARTVLLPLDFSSIISSYPTQIVGSIPGLAFALDARVGLVIDEVFSFPFFNCLRPGACMIFSSLILVVIVEYSVELGCRVKSVAVMMYYLLDLFHFILDHPLPLTLLRTTTLLLYTKHIHTEMSESPIDVDRSDGEEEDVKPKSEETLPRKRVCHSLRRDS